MMANGNAPQETGNFSYHERTQRIRIFLDLVILALAAGTFAVTLSMKNAVTGGPAEVGGNVGSRESSSASPHRVSVNWSESGPSVVAAPLTADETAQQSLSCVEPGYVSRYFGSESAYKKHLKEAADCAKNAVAAFYLNERIGGAVGSIAAIKDSLETERIARSALASGSGVVDIGFFPGGDNVEEGSQNVFDPAIMCVKNQAAQTSEAEVPVGALGKKLLVEFVPATPKQEAELSSAVETVGQANERIGASSDSDVAVIREVYGKLIGLLGKPLIADPSRAAKKWFKPATVAFYAERGAECDPKKIVRFLVNTFTKVKSEDKWYMSTLRFGGTKSDNAAVTLEVKNKCVPYDAFPRLLIDSIDKHSKKLASLLSDHEKNLKAWSADLQKMKDNNYYCAPQKQEGPPAPPAS